MMEAMVMMAMMEQSGDGLSDDVFTDGGGENGGRTRRRSDRL